LMDVGVFLKGRFDTEAKCVGYLEELRWPNGVHCPACGNSKISRFQTVGKTGKARHLYQCLEKGCRYQFSVTTGTIFHDSHLPLTKWFSAIALVSASQEPVSASQLRQQLGVQYRTAQHVLQRVLETLQTGRLDSAPEHVALSDEKTELPSPRLRHYETVERASHTSASIAISVARPDESGTTVDNALSIAASLAQMTILPPLFFVNCISRILS